MTSNSIRDTHNVNDSRATEFGFVLTILFLILEYARPQDKIPAIGVFRPAWIIILLMIITWQVSGRIRMALSPQTSHMLLLLLLLAFHVPFSDNNFRAYTVTRSFLLLFPLIVSIIVFVDSLDKLRLLMKWWSLLALYLALNGLLGSGVAGSAFLSDENDFSLLMNMMLPFVLCLFVYEQHKITKLAYLATSFLCVASIVVSNSRGGFVGLLTVLAVIWLGSPRKLLFLALAGLLIAGLYIVADQVYWERMATIQKTDEGTAKERLDSWDAGWKMFKDNLLGVGPGNFPVRFPEYQPDSMTRSMWGRQAHSLWFTLLPELGIPGVILYLSLFHVNLRDLWFLKRCSGDDDNRRYFSLLFLAFIASFTGYFVSGTFLSVLYYPHYWYLSAMIVAAKRVTDSQTR